jgi:outer membrane immunogenic protein
MRRIITTAFGLIALAGAAQSAAAADLRPPVVKAPVEVWSWTGVYVGANVGYSWGRSSTDLAVNTAPGGVPLYATSTAFDLRGIAGGVQVGVNWQSGIWVGGFETDIQGTGQKGSAGFACPATGCNTSGAVPAAARIVSGTIEQKLQWFGTLRARLGVTITPTVLAYATGGLAYGNASANGTLSGVGAAGPVSTTISNDDSTTEIGWTAGIGVEALLAGNWTGRIEYLYLDVGKVSGATTLAANVPQVALAYTSRITDSIVRVGINYKFDPGPIVAKY